MQYSAPKARSLTVRRCPFILRLWLLIMDGYRIGPVTEMADFNSAPKGGDKPLWGRLQQSR